MNWDAIGAVGEIIGAAAVVLTLFYLSLQIRMSTRQQRVESQRATGEGLNKLMDTYNDLDKAGMIIRAQSNWANANAQEQNILAIHLIQYTNHLATMLNMWRSGGIDENTYVRHESGFLHILSTDGGMAWWAFFSDMIDPALSDRINMVLSEKSFPPIYDVLPWAKPEPWKKPGPTGT